MCIRDRAAVLENEKKPGRGVRNLYEWVDALVTSLITVIILFTFIFRVVSVSGPSMIPTLYSEDRVVLWSYFYQPKQGDVVVITHTAKLTEPIIKRIIAVEGQEIDVYKRQTLFLQSAAAYARRKASAKANVCAELKASRLVLGVWSAMLRTGI